MAYATVAQLRAYLKQLPTLQSTPNATAQMIADTDALLTDVLERATGAIDAFLEFGFAAYGAATTISVPAVASAYIALPAHDVATVPTVTHRGLVVTDFSHIVERSRGYLFKTSLWPNDRIDVTAKWGYGAAPRAVEEVCLELAVNIWRSRDKGMFSDVVGVESALNPVGGGAVGYSGALTKHQNAVLNAIKRKYELTAV